jgi:hypothetical protein
VLNKWKTDRPASVLHDLLARRVVCDEDDSVVVLVSVFSVLEELVDALFVVVHLLPLFLVSEAEDEQLVSVVFQHLREASFCCSMLLNSSKSLTTALRSLGRILPASSMACGFRSLISLVM